MHPIIPNHTPPRFQGRFSVKFENKDFRPYGARYQLLRTETLGDVMRNTYGVTTFQDLDDNYLGSGTYQFMKITGHVSDDMASRLKNLLEGAGGKYFRHTPDKKD